MNRKICIITGSRADYGLLRWIMQCIRDDPSLTLQIIVTGMHLSPEFGSTYKEIEQDGFSIDHKVEMLLSSDTKVGVTKSMGIGLIGIADALEILKPDIAVILGDRFEILAAATALTVLRIPVAHLHGGENTEGAIDDVFRHAITKMAHLHFTSTESYRARVIQLGEHPDRVFNVGAPGLESIRRLELLNKEILEHEHKINFGDRNLLVTYHPETTTHGQNERYLGALLDALDKLKGTTLIFTKSNADAEGRQINEIIDKFVDNNSHRAVAHTSLGQTVYFSVMKQVDGVVGNSSSGIIEAPSLGVGTVNIGDRQRGRIKADSVIDCESNVDSIRTAVAKLFTSEYRSKLHRINNPYGDGNVAEKIVAYLRNSSLGDLLTKQFYNFS